MDNDNSIIECLNLEEWLINQNDNQFPKYYPEKGEKSYPEKYNDLKKALLPFHKNVEKGALLESVNKWHKDIIKEIEKVKKSRVKNKDTYLKELEDKMQCDPVIYLNQHGVGHVEKVIEKVLELIKKFRFGYPSASEVFILLCAIQIHDIGNIYGRDGHETSFATTFHELAKDIIPDSVTRKNILKIAQVHSGNIYGDKDTITKANLQYNKTWFNKQIREPILAALLRFGDELADDSSRFDKVAFDMKKIPKESLIYHEYSKSLHAVNIFDHDINKTCYVSLEFYIDSKAVTVEYLKGNKPILLMDEIFNRTKKMEQERRYCMRFLSQFIPLTEIMVKIEIEPEESLMQMVPITYTLSEKGYPANDIIIEGTPNTGEQVRALLQEKGWKL